MTKVNSKSSGMSFPQAVSRFRKVILNRLEKLGEVSSVDLTDVVGSVRGSLRGAAVRRAFQALEEDGLLRETNNTVYNSKTRHRVSVYGRPTTR